MFNSKVIKMLLPVLRKNVWLGQPWQQQHDRFGWMEIIQMDMMDSMCHHFDHYLKN